MNDELESSPMAAGAGIHCRTAWLVSGWRAPVSGDASREPRAEEAVGGGASVPGGASSFRWSRVGGGATTCRGTRVRGSAGEGRRHRHLGMLSGPAREEGVGQIWAKGAFFFPGERDGDGREMTVGMAGLARGKTGKKKWSSPKIIKFEFKSPQIAF